MDNLSSITISTTLQISFVLLCLLFIITHFYKKRWIYYYATKLPGPFWLPFLGTVRVAFAGQKNSFSVTENYLKIFPRVWKIWLGSQLYVVTSRPSDIDTLLNNFSSKENILLYQFSEESFSSLFSSEVHIWKNHRRTITPSFNQQIINSFNDIFVKYARLLNNALDQYGGKGSIDVLPLVWQHILDSLVETLADVNPRYLRKKNDDYANMIVRYEKLLTERFFNVPLHFTFFWKMSSLRKELAQTVHNMFDHIQDIIDLNKQSKFASKESNSDNVKKRTYLNNLLTKDLTKKELLEETTFMYIAGSETTALVTSSVLLVMSIYPEIQEKINDEQYGIFAADDRDATLDDIHQMFYLERVIKETMRFLPPGPYLARYIDKTTELDSCVYPAGSAVLVPVRYVHKHPDIWPNPSKFDPDRFLPEEVKRRPRGSYMPFGYGVRNCIGINYGMLSMKTILSTVLRRFKVKPGKYKSIEEIEVEFHLMIKAKDGYKLAFEKRNS